MNVDYLIQLLGNRLTALATAKEQAFLTGDLEMINKMDAELNEVLNTVNKLKLLQGISETAAVTPFTEAEVVQNGIEASFGIASSNTVSGTGSVAPMDEYDISSYATDPLHEQKIASILSGMGEMTSPELIDVYIKAKAISSPLNGQMIFEAANSFTVDVRLMMAIMEQDSRYGTAGVAVDTFNPGNVGNTGSATKTYGSWQAGVEAVAEWLSRHRKTVAVN